MKRFFHRQAPHLLPSLRLVGGRRLGSMAVCAILLATGPAPFSAAAEPSSPSSLDARIQALKDDALELTRDLSILEEDLLFPKSTQLAVFLAVDAGEFFRLDTVQLRIDDEVVTNYLYSERESDALKKGGVQRLFLGNLRTGEHELVAIFTGKGRWDRDYRRGTQLKFKKSPGTKYIQLNIIDGDDLNQPQFEVREWD